ncbi:MAG: hypothetical protein JNN15_05455 [Blastocatellia bacterium]|nr:hypothetical protein [Blastocatellia bacterium]
MNKSKQELEQSLQEYYRKLFRELSFLICLDEEKNAKVILIAASILWGFEGVEEEIERARGEIKNLLEKIDSDTKQFYDQKYSQEDDVENKWDWNLFEEILNKI